MVTRAGWKDRGLSNSMELTDAIGECHAQNNNRNLT
jgi:hypothetical protein